MPSRFESRGAVRSGVEPSPSVTTGVDSLTGNRSRYRSISEGIDCVLTVQAQPSSTTPRSETTGSTDGAPWTLEQLRDLGERGVDLALRCLVEDDVQRRARARGHLRQPRDGDVVRGEPLRHVGQDSGLVVDFEVHVERRAEVSGRHTLEGPPTRVVVQEAGAGRSDDADHVRDDSGGRLTTPAPGPSSVISRMASPWSMTALNAPSIAASGW